LPVIPRPEWRESSLPVVRVSPVSGVRAIFGLP
jgi:hypothetical protein